jgi:hypothetical protein
MPAAIMAAGTILLGHALHISNGFYNLTALTCLLLAILCCGVAALRLLPARWQQSRDRTVITILLAGIASNFVVLAVSEPGMYLAEPSPAQHPLFIALLIIAATFITCGASGMRALGMRRLWFPLTLGMFAALGIWMIQASPTPHVDVITVYESAWHALRHGKDPYTMTFPNIYSNNDLYPPGYVVAGRVLLGFPYPPLSLLLGLPGMIFGDVRYADVAALIGTAAFIGYTRRNLIAPLAAVLLLSSPRALFVIEQAWTEPLTLVTFGATIYFAVRKPRGWMLPISLGLLVATKQYMIVAFPLAWLLTQPDQRGRDWLRLIIIASIAGAMVTLPFMVWNLGGFMKSVVELQFQERFRLDSLSLLSWIHYSGIGTLTPERILAASGLALIVTLIVSLWRASRTPAGFAAAIALVLLCVFVSSKKAFCNYYFCGLGVMCASIAAQRPADD